MRFSTSAWLPPIIIQTKAAQGPPQTALPTTTTHELHTATAHKKGREGPGGAARAWSGLTFKVHGTQGTAAQPESGESVVLPRGGESAPLSSLASTSFCPGGSWPPIAAPAAASSSAKRSSVSAWPFLRTAAERLGGGDSRKGCIINKKYKAYGLSDMGCHPTCGRGNQTLNGMMITWSFCLACSTA